MCNVLVIDNDRMERSVTKTILNKNYADYIAIFEADNHDEAYKALAERNMDLIISNMTYSAVHLMKLVNFAKNRNPEAAIILTTAKSEMEVAHAVLKLKANGYLLKPFKPELLLTATRPYVMREQATDVNTKSKKSAEALKKLSFGIREHKYGKCTDSAKEYIKRIYDTYDTKDEICDYLSEYTRGIAELAEDYDVVLYEKLLADSRRIKTKWDKFGQRNIGYILSNDLVMDMINQIFNELDKEYIYSEDISKALNHIDRNIKRGVTLEEAAECVSMSSCYFSKLFKKATGENFIAYVTNRKMELAKELLHYTDMPVINIAYDLSYNETNYFSKAFKKKVGKTPTEYREQFSATK